MIMFSQFHNLLVITVNGSIIFMVFCTAVFSLINQFCNLY